ncbi:hypothetical protein CBS147320_506 [Aspergillus niger]|nr:hypothetical protein CBS11350_1637 [Aspergillus niger]KAI2889982.1 hypothetical protein CBS11852_6594 [Aspergillus niger]KAI2925258.1 hypothetical protein CBS147371_816 [Aspergillus niger]KAI2935499.1 hypothetical protein CBS147320_506 [Aspergillus niger]
MHHDLVKSCWASDISSFSFSCLSYLFLARSPFFFSPPFSPFRSGRHGRFTPNSRHHRYLISSFPFLDQTRSAQ